MQICSRTGYNYFVTFIDDTSRHVEVVFLKEKSEVLTHLKTFGERAEVSTGVKVKILQSDSGGEYGSKEFKSYLDSKGIQHEKTKTYMPQENGVAERMNRTLVESSQAMLRDASLPDSYWADAVEYAVEYAAHIWNVVPTRALSGTTPHEAWSGNSPDLNQFRIFGCKAYVHIPDEKWCKLDSKAVQWMFIGYVTDKKAYCCIDWHTGTVYESCNVIFDEGKETHSEWVTVEVNTDLDEAVANAPTPIESDDNNDDLPWLLEDVESDDEDEDEEIDTSPSDGKTMPATHLPPPEPLMTSEPCHSGRIRWQPVPDNDEHYTATSYGPRKASKPLDDAHAKVVQTEHKELETYEEAMSGPDAPLWKAACANELLSFTQTKLYDELERPRGQKVVDCKWVFKVKHGPDGEITRYKAWLIAWGFTQVEGIHYNETFAPVAKFTSIRMLLALAAHLDLELHQMDVKTAFLHGDLNEEIYMNLPPGFPKPNVVWKLKKGLYGLKQASREWYKKIRTEFEGLGFKQCQSDHSIFHLSKGDTPVIIVIYVDDLLILHKSLDAMNEVKMKLKDHFEMTDLGEACWILSMEVTRNHAERAISLSQHHYIQDILEQHGMAKCRPVSMPMVPNLTLEKLKEPEIDATTYQSAVGSLMYAMIGMHPDLAHAVGVLSQFSANPGIVHWTALKCVFRYLQGNGDVSIVFDEKKGNAALTGYVDADWAADKNDRHSITGYVFLLCGGAIS
jgi:Reverse transcriptase (RNA-dependent DNA polymerase)/Integrase core domain